MGQVCLGDQQNRKEIADSWYVTDNRLTIILKVIFVEFLTLEDVEADQGRYLARVVSAVDLIKLSEARLTTDQWEEIGKEIRQPHSKLR